jgi:hypothetical protein
MVDYVKRIVIIGVLDGQLHGDEYESTHERADELLSRLNDIGYAHLVQSQIKAKELFGQLNAVKNCQLKGYIKNYVDFGSDEEWEKFFDELEANNG